MARPGKYQLSLSQLAEFDDLLTDALVDRVYYWTKIRKMKHSYHPNRGIKTEDVVRIIVHEAVRSKNTAGALQKFLELNGVKQYLNKVSNKSPNAEGDFVKHARRYLSMYSPDAGFEVSSTNRYNPLSPEACIISRRTFRRGEPIKYLTGAMVRMSSAEEDAFTNGATDFSIIYSTRVGAMSLLLGPARFVNHDCEPNAKFVTTNKDNVTLIVERDVDVGEELTVRYADDYFGDGNRECLCRTCEVQMRNGWAGGIVRGSEEEEEEEIDIDSLVPGAIVTRRSGRRVLAETLDEVEKRNRRRRSGAQVMSPPDSARGMSVETGVSTAPSVVDEREDLRPVPEDLRPATPPPTNGVGTPAEVAVDIAAVKADTPAAEADAALPADITAAKADTPPPTHPAAATPDMAKSFGLSAPLSALAMSSTATDADADTDSDLSDFTDIDDADIDDALLTLALPAPTTRRTKKKKRAAPLPPQPPLPAAAPIPSLIEPPRPRVPGDYLSWRLSTDGTKCVCSDCHKTFIHDDRWYVPRACKRCERHSKIYGLVWPKTVKRKNDSEEQIDDHRLIQRYVTASEHRKEQRKLEEDELAAESIRARRRSSYNPVPSTATATTATTTSSSSSSSRSTAAGGGAGSRKRKRGKTDVDVEREMEDIDGVFDALKGGGRGGKRSRLEAEVIR